MATADATVTASFAKTLPIKKAALSQSYADKFDAVSGAQYAAWSWTCSMTVDGDYSFLSDDDAAVRIKVGGFDTAGLFTSVADLRELEANGMARTRIDANKGTGSVTVLLAADDPGAFAGSIALRWNSKGLTAKITVKVDELKRNATYPMAADVDLAAGDAVGVVECQLTLAGIDGKAVIADYIPFAGKIKGRTLASKTDTLELFSYTVRGSK